MSSVGEIILLLVIAGLIFGPGKLPAVMTTIGKGVKEFKEGQRNARDAFRVDAAPPDDPDQRS
jgi:TatA/E family protein of Tat protein translocase